MHRESLVVASCAPWGRGGGSDEGSLLGGVLHPGGVASSDHGVGARIIARGGEWRLGAHHDHRVGFPSSAGG